MTRAVGAFAHWSGMVGPMENSDYSRYYPPVDPSDLRNAHGFENIIRVVVSQKGVYGLTNDGVWVEFRPLERGGIIREKR